MTIEREYDKLTKQAKAVSDKLKALQSRVIADGNCPHTRVYEHEQDCDNGYGRWWRVKVETCRICGYRRYPESSAQWRPLREYLAD